jgi:hypothetical protein
MTDLLLKKGAKIEEQSISLVAVAIVNKSENALDALIKNKINLNISVENIWMPLDLAILQGDKNIEKKLRENGAVSFLEILNKISSVAEKKEN